jgi:hypothetical protein
MEFKHGPWLHLLSRQLDTKNSMMVKTLHKRFHITETQWLGEKPFKRATILKTVHII